MNWIKNHYQWVFSGAGVAVAIALLNWFFVSPSRENSASSQVQSGIGSVQVNGDVFISGKSDEELNKRITSSSSLDIDSSSLVTINSDKSWTVIVPPTESGVSLRSNNDEFKINRGDKIEILVSGYVNIGRGSFGPNGEPNYKDSTMDSPYKDHVGGLEMWVGDKKNRYFVGDHFSHTVNHSGIPTFRVIESRYGYTDGNTGSFKAVIKKVDLPETP